jgi:fructokinase
MFRAFAELVSLFHVNEMIVTMAEKGAWWIHPNGTEFTAAAAPENFIDSVGAGDAFSAAALRGIALNRQRKETLQLCTDFAARVCGIKGAVPQSDTFYNEEACGKKGGSP